MFAAGNIGRKWTGVDLISEDEGAREELEKELGGEKREQRASQCTVYA